MAKRLELELCSYHEEDDDCLFSFALQPYWRVGALSRVVVHGMELSRARGQRASPVPGTWIPRGAVKQVLYHPGSLVLEDGGWNRRLRIDKNVSAGSAIWHPGVPGGAGRAGRSGTLPLHRRRWLPPGGLILAPGERMRR
ncbi:hypothetical protein P4123_06790 [Pseudomonas aeruginosa]|nr:hypothetical protein [Pseudomonas aeruginosa]